MSRGNSILRNGVFAAVVAASLGFGATQAFAEPRGGAAAQVCGSGTVCNTWCQNRGFDYGECVDGFCACWYL